MKKDTSIILKFLQRNVLATISTVNPQTLQPESALIAFCELENLEILFLTLKGSRKYNNLLKNNRIALVAGFDERPSNWATLQYEGKAFLVSRKDEYKYRSIFIKKDRTPCGERFFEKKGMRLFKITPTWIGFSVFPQDSKPQVIELKFNLEN